MKLKDKAQILTGFLRTREEGGEIEYKLVDFSCLENNETKKFLSRTEHPENSRLKDTDLLIKLWPIIDVFFVKENQIGAIVPSNIGIIRTEKKDTKIIYYLLKTKLKTIDRFLDCSTIKILKKKDLEDIDISEIKENKNISLKADLFIKYEFLSKLYLRKSKLIKKQQKFYASLKGN